MPGIVADVSLREGQVVLCRGRVASTTAIKLQPYTKNIPFLGVSGFEDQPLQLKEVENTNRV